MISKEQLNQYEKEGFVYLSSFYDLENEILPIQKDIDPLHLSRDLQIDEILQNDIDNKNLKSTDSEFQQIIQEITNLFIPQKITNEEHLQSQITIFLQARYPEKIEQYSNSN